MAIGFQNRNPLGLALTNSIMPGDQPNYMPTPDMAPHTFDQDPNAGKKPGGFFKEGGMGRYLAGVIGDALLQNGGMQPMFLPMQQAQREAQQQEVIWNRRQQQQRDAANQDWYAHQEYENSHRPDDEFTRMIRAAGIDPASPEGQTFYRQRVERQTAEPDIVTPLPNGQMYVGPRSGLAAALTGQVAAPAAAPRLGPVVDSIPGGPQARPAGTFR